MKKTQKIFALILAVMMISSCFGMIVMAEDTEMITVVSATMTDKNTYVIEFSAPVHFHATNQIFRRQEGYANGNLQQYNKVVSYVGDVSTVSEKEYSKHVQIRFTEDLDPAFNLAKYGILLAEYTTAAETKAEHFGWIDPTILSGVNGEPVESNYQSTSGTLDFVWITTAPLNTADAYVTIENAYEDDIRVLSVDVSEDFSTYTLKFSAPVTVASRSSVWFRPSGPESGTGQVNPTATEYLGTTVTYGGQTFSDTVKFTIDPEGGEYNNKTLREASEGFTKYGISFTEYTNKAASHAGYIFPGTITGFNGRMLKCNYTNASSQDFCWIPSYGADTAFNYKVHLNFGAPYVVSATRLVDCRTIRVEFNEPVAYVGGAWDIIMRENYWDGTNQANLATAETTVSGETVTVGDVTYGTVLEFKTNDHSTIAADGAFGMTFCEYNDSAHVMDGIVTAAHIKDVDGNGLTANVNGEGKHDFGWIPTDAADPDNVYPVHLEIEIPPEEIEVASYEELKTALAKYTGVTVKVTEDLVANEGIVYEYDEDSGKVLVIDDNEGSVMAEIGTGKNGTTAGQIILGSVDTLETWTALVPNGNVIDFQGHTVSGYMLAANENTYGLFKSIDKASTVKNVNVENVFANVAVQDARYGTIAAYNFGTIENVTVDAIAIVNESRNAYVGFVVGLMNSTKGAQVEYFNPTVYNATTDGHLFLYGTAGSPCIGGIVGKTNGGKIVNCVNYGDVLVTGAVVYGAGGLVGLAEFAAGGPFTATTDFTAKTLENIYVVNNANYGAVEGSTGMKIGGLIGYADLIWSAGSSMTVVNNYNSGKLVNGMSGIIGYVQGISSLGSGTVAYNFNFESTANNNPLSTTGSAYRGNAVRYSTMASALENLNRNVGNFQDINGEAVKAWAWKEANGVIIPDSTLAIPEVQDATPATIVETEYDPETEIYITSVKLIKPNWLEITFSEPVMKAEGANFYGGIRYCDVSTGIPNLMYANLDGNDGNEPVQFDRGSTYIIGDKMYMKWNDREYAVSNDVKDVLGGTAHGDKVTNPGVFLCIEGSTGSVSGILEEITSLDGTKTLKASYGKSHSTGKYDGVYFPIENPYADDDFVNPEESDECVVLESAELAGPHSLKLNFSEPVQLLENTSAWLSIRYCKYAADGYTFNYMTDDGAACQAGFTLTNLTCDENGAYIADFGENVDMLSLVNGTAWEGADLVLISIEQLPAQVEEGTIGFVDNIVSVADPAKKLAASPAKTDVSKNDSGEYGPYDGAYAYILAHEHDYTVANHDADNHWNECICGLVDEESVAEHVFEDGENCACGAKKYIVGDVNADEAVDADDAIYLLYNVFFNDVDYPINQPADFNNDSTVDADDAIYLLYHVFFGANEYPLFPVAAE